MKYYVTTKEQLIAGVPEEFIKYGYKPLDKKKSIDILLIHEKIKVVSPIVCIEKMNDAKNMLSEHITGVFKDDTENHKASVYHGLLKLCCFVASYKKEWDIEKDDFELRPGIAYCTSIDDITRETLLELGIDASENHTIRDKEHKPYGKVTIIKNTEQVKGLINGFSSWFLEKHGLNTIFFKILEDLLGD